MTSPHYARDPYGQSTLPQYAEQHRVVDAMIRGIYENRVALAARRTAYQEKIRCAYAMAKSGPLACTALHRLLNDLGRRAEEILRRWARESRLSIAWSL